MDCISYFCFLNKFDKPSLFLSFTLVFYPRFLCLWHFDQALLICVSYLCLNSPHLLRSCNLRASAGTQNALAWAHERLLTWLMQLHAQLLACPGAVCWPLIWAIWQPPPELPLSGLLPGPPTWSSSVCPLKGTTGPHCTLWPIPSLLCVLPAPLTEAPYWRLGHNLCPTKLLILIPPRTKFHCNSLRLQVSLYPSSYSCPQPGSPSSSSSHIWSVSNSCLFKVLVKPGCFPSSPLLPLDQAAVISAWVAVLAGRLTALLLPCPCLPCPSQTQSPLHLAVRTVPCLEHASGFLSRWR